MSVKFLLPVLMLGLAVQACAPKPAEPAPPPPPPPPPPHIGPPAAETCVVAPFHVADGGTAAVDMTVSNEGGYCAATLTTAAGQPYDAPLIHAMPDHGTPRVVRYNGKTSVEYVPGAGFTGHDHFTVALIEKGSQADTTLNVSVTVVPPGGTAGTAAKAPDAKVTAPSTAK